MVEVGRVSDDAFVFFVEGVHRPPRERDTVAQHAGVVRKVGMLPRAVGRAALADRHGEPVGFAQVAVPGGPVLRAEDARRDILDREERHRV